MNLDFRARSAVDGARQYAFAARRRPLPPADVCPAAGRYIVGVSPAASATGRTEDGTAPVRRLVHAGACRVI